MAVDLGIAVGLWRGFPLGLTEDSVIKGGDCEAERVPALDRVGSC